MCRPAAVADSTPSLGTSIYCRCGPEKEGKKSLQMINVGEGMEKMTPSYIVGRNVTMKNSMEVP